MPLPSGGGAAQTGIAIKAEKEMNSLVSAIPAASAEGFTLVAGAGALPALASHQLHDQSSVCGAPTVRRQ
ncbi:hypothetical protein ACFPOU_09890 [Massilia jejuensis]|uniref:Uncharacterized protein n=1 Tax=Massilia jejuensis TaxID=648894 RepID=A0ABW0PHD1_9BURK